MGKFIIKASRLLSIVTTVLLVELFSLLPHGGMVAAAEHAVRSQPYLVAATGPVVDITSGTSYPETVAMSGSIQETALFSDTTTTISTSPSGLSITVDSVTYTAPAVFTWTPGSIHTISTTSPQTGAAATRYVFASWSDGGARTHSVTAPSTQESYIASFSAQYLLIMIAGSGGSVSPPSGYYDAGNAVSISATLNTGYMLTGWTGTGVGSYSGGFNPATVTISGPIQETASFSMVVPGITAWGIMSLVLLFGSAMLWMIWRQLIRGKTH